MKKIYLILISLFLIAGCKQTGQITVQPEQNSPYKNINIFMGEMLFYEWLSPGFSRDDKVSWASNDLTITSGGEISGAIRTVYDGPNDSYEKVDDVLFLQVFANYTLDNPIPELMGDDQPNPVPISEDLKIRANSADASRASFTIKSELTLPPLKKNGQTLGSVSIKLTWVRIYKKDGEYYLQVLPGQPKYIFADDVKKYYALLKFDQKAKNISGNFQYFAPNLIYITQGGLGGYKDYREWIVTNILNGCPEDYTQKYREAKRENSAILPIPGCAE